MTERGAYRQLVTLQGQGTAVPDGQGGYTMTPTVFSPPTWYCSIRPASQRDLERTTVGTAITEASHIVEGDYRADITTATQLVFGSRVLYVNDVINVEERNITLRLACTEAVAA